MAFGTVKLNDGNEMPAIAFGTGSKWKGHDVTDYVLQTLETGFSHVDTAQGYFTEDCVGRAIRASGIDRSDLYITTKWSGRSYVTEAIRESLEKLGVERVDLYLVHSPPHVKNLEKDWGELEKIKETGLAKSIGVSNYNLKRLQEIVNIARIKPAVNQILFHPYNYAENKELLDYCTEHGIIIEAYGSLAPITQYPGGPVDKPLQAAAVRLNATPTQILLSWLRSKGVTIVTTSSSREHLREYLAVADLPALTQEEIAAIDEAGSQGPPSSNGGLPVTVRSPLAHNAAH